MKQPEQADRGFDRALYSRLRWFIGLRWVAGSVGLLLALLNLFVLRWFPDAQTLPWVATFLLGYNLLLSIRLRHTPRHRRSMIRLAWTQILLDLLCLTLLVMSTRGWQSPVLGFYVFHMVFASLLLPRRMAYASAGAAILFLLGGLAFDRLLPTTLTGQLGLIGWSTTILLTVYLTNHITQYLRRYQQQLLKRNHRIRAMGRRLQQQQSAMVQQEKMVALGQMAAGLSHEIANPLANMDSILQLMQRKPDRMTPERIDQLREQVGRIRETIRRMSDFAHPTQMSWEAVQLSKIVEDAAAMLRYDKRVKGVDLRVEPPAGTCRVKVQPHAMQQIVVNLLMNALDAVADRPSPEVTVRGRCAGGRCMIDVIDNGPGIPEEQYDRLFEPFYTTKPVGKGTGLGLAICYWLASRQGAEISVHSSEGSGTRMTVSLQKAGPSDDRASA